MDRDLEAFLEEYDDKTSDVESADYQYFENALQQWFGLLSSNPRVGELIAVLKADFSFEPWFSSSVRMQGSRVGSGVIDWPPEPKNFLAARLGIFEAINDDKLDFLNFGRNYAYVRDGNFNDTTRSIVSQIFRPLARDLRRYLTRTLEAQEGPVLFAAPASDRTVALDHNSVGYSEVLAKLDAVEKALRETNDYDDADDKEQRLAELGAGRDLLRAPRARLAAVGTVLGTCLLFLANKFGTVALGVMANAAWAAITGFFQISFPM